MCKDWFLITKISRYRIKSSAVKYF